MLSFFSGITCFLFFFFFLLLINQLSANCFYQTYPFKNEMKIYFIFYIIKNKVCKAQLAYMQNLPGSVTCFASHNKFKMTTLRHGMFTTLQAYTLARLNTCKERSKTCDCYASFLMSKFAVNETFRYFSIFLEIALNWIFRIGIEITCNFTYT